MPHKKAKSLSPAKQALDDAIAQLADLTAAVFRETRARATASDIQKFLNARAALVTAIKKLL